jgi:hypothetical protein
METFKDYTILGKSRDPVYDLKSASRSSRITHTRRFNTYLLLFQDEKGPIAAKTYDGSSWSSVQAKVEHDQPTRR